MSIQECINEAKTKVIPADYIGDYWLVQVGKVEDVTNPDYDHAYQTPDNSVYVLSHDGSGLVPIGTGGVGGEPTHISNTDNLLRITGSGTYTVTVNVDEDNLTDFIFEEVRRLVPCEGSNIFKGDVVSIIDTTIRTDYATADPNGLGVGIGEMGLSNCNENYFTLFNSAPIIKIDKNAFKGNRNLTHIVFHMDYRWGTVGDVKLELIIDPEAFTDSAFADPDIATITDFGLYAPHDEPTWDRVSQIIFENPVLKALPNNQIATHP